MVETVNEESGVEECSKGQDNQIEQALLNLLSCRDSDEDTDDDCGVKPSELFVRHTWKIEKFSEIKEREIHSSGFEAGGYEWYVLVYPQGRDVQNHLSLFLCVKNHHTLLPGWSQFAQFTISLVHKDPKKSKYSDTLHRFWKTEHDWGWKKFIELPKLQYEFIDPFDSLTIVAQVQVIRERVDRPFRCLDGNYRRELSRVYLINVEEVFRNFVDEKRSKLEKLVEDKARWTSFGVFWVGLDQNSRLGMSTEKRDVILKGVVKHFFKEKEVTSTLVMDSLYTALKALDDPTKNKKVRPGLIDTEESPALIVSVDKDMFALADDALLLVERASLDPLPLRDEKGPQNRMKIWSDERRVTELAIRTMELFVLDHIFSKVEVAYQEDIALKMQEAIIR
ncbi:unnamed protein product [Cochlearia groenlandica]